MTINDLEQQISVHLASPQKSERWAMYRLIAPVVDFANASMGLTAYFEFNQTSEHKTSQSVDIALLDGLKPKVMIEAKRLDRRIAAEQISKYLCADVRGLVTNGMHWIMCSNGLNKTLCMLDNEGNASAQSIKEIVAFIQGNKFDSTGWSSSNNYVNPILRTG